MRASNERASNERASNERHHSCQRQSLMMAMMAALLTFRFGCEEASSLFQFSKIYVARLLPTAVPVCELAKSTVLQYG